MILNSTTQSLRIVLSSAVAANQSPITVDYVDFTTTSTTPGLQLSTTNSTTAVTILDAPGANTQRKVNGVTLVNKDTSPIIATISLYDTTGGGIDYQIASIKVEVETTLQFTDTKGWFCTNSAGQMLVAEGSMYSDVQIFTANTTWVKPQTGSVAFVECVGGGGSGGGGQGGSGGSIRFGGGGGGGGKRVTAIYLLSDLSNTSIIVGSSISGANGGILNSGFTANVGNPSSFGNLLIAYGGGGGIGGGGPGGNGGNAGGGGGGGSSSGLTPTIANGGTGGAALGAGGTGGGAAAAGISPTDAGGGGGGGQSISYVIGGSSYLGGGGGGGSYFGVTAGAGGGSVTSAAGGGGGGSINSFNPGTSNLGGQGGITGATANTAGGGPLPAAINTGLASANGLVGDSTRCGGGGTGGSAHNAGTGSRGGDGGFPGGGGGGGGGGTPTGGRGGDGAGGRVAVYVW